MARAAYEREIDKCQKREAEIEKEIATIRKQQQELEAQFDQLDQLQQQTAAKGVYVYENVLLTRDEMVALSIAMYGWHCSKRGKAWSDAEYDRAYEEIKSLGLKGKEARLADIISEMNKVRDRINDLEDNIRGLQKQHYKQVDLRETIAKKLAALPGSVEARGSAKVSEEADSFIPIAGLLT